MNAVIGCLLCIVLALSFVMIFIFIAIKK